MAAEKLQLTQQLLTIAADAFDSTELEMVGYFFRGEASASPAASGGGHKKVLFDLLLWADREGRLLDLAKRLAGEKPNCAELQRVVGELRQILAPQDRGGTTAGLKTPPAHSADLPGSVATSPAINSPAGKSSQEAVVPPQAAAAPSHPAPGLAASASPSAPRRPRAATGGVSVYFGTATPDERGQQDRKAVIDSVLQIKQWPVRVLSAPEIFVSFAWGDDQTPAGVQRQQAVDQLCDQLEEQGFLVRRDSQEIRYGGVISEYMHRLGRADRVLVILSEKYLRSISCMTELHLIYQRSKEARDEFLQRVIPVALEDARFSTPEERADHADHWKARMEGLGNRWKSLGEKDLQLLHAMGGWSQNIGDMLAFLNDTLAPRRLDEIRQADFEALRELLRSSPDGAPAEDPLEQATLFVQVLGEQGSKATPQRPWGLEGRQFLAARQAGIPCLRWRPRDLDLETIRRHHPQYVEYLSSAADPADLPPEERVQAGYLPDFQKLIEETLRKLVARETKTSGATNPSPPPAPARPPAHSEPSPPQSGTPAIPPIQALVPSAVATPGPTAGSVRPSVLFAPQQVDEDLAVRLDQELRVAFGPTVATEIASAEYPLSTVYEHERGVLVIYGQGSLDWVQERVREARDIALDRARNAPLCALYVGPPDGKPPLKKRPPMVRIIPHDDPDALRRYLAELTNGGPA